MKIISSIIAFFIITNMSHKMQAEPLLQYLVREPRIKSEKPPVIFLLHGVGSNEKDLFSFANQLPDRYLVISLRAPLSLGPESYAWFQVSFAGGKPVANIEQAEKSRLLILQFIEELKTNIKFDDTQIYLCGFSQGGVMAYFTGLTNPGKIKGIAVMSGRLIEEVKPMIVVNDKLKQLKVFISHGTNDQVLLINYARDGYAYVKQLGLHPIYKEYSEGHTISGGMLADLIDWLK